MITKESLERLREAFRRVQRKCDLKGWDLDDTLGSPFLQESGSDRLTVSLLRGDAERTSVSLDIKSLLLRGGEISAESLVGEIEAALREKGILH